jgi:hypothetical protein
MKTRTERSYCLTSAGASALAARRSVPAWYRSILGFVECRITAGAILKLMTADQPKQVLAWIEELETLGFVVEDAQRRRSRA